jgi:arylsulfatase A-like enzyme
MTLTSHASLFTGRYPEQHGARPPDTPLPASVPALAEILAGAGYRTAAVVANTGYATAEMGLARGFQYFDQRGPVRLASANARGVTVTRGNGYLRGVVGRSAARLIPGYSTRPYYRDAAEISAEVIERLGPLAEAERPFFLFVNYMDAHMPYLPPPPFDGSFPGRDASYSWSDYPALRDDLVHGFRTIEPRERAHLISQYDGAIAYQDEQLARVIDRLAELDLYDETLIIVTSDHGEAFGKRGVLTHGATLYQEQIHVPLIAKYPLTRQGRVRDELVDGVDVMPTILDLLGLAIPDGVQGHSLLRDHAATAVLSESFPSAAAPHSVFERALITPDHFKLIAGAGGVQLFDLSHDPGETSNLRHRDSARVGMLGHLLGEPLPAQHGARPASEDAIDRHTAQQLRALGYLE